MLQEIEGTSDNHFTTDQRNYLSLAALVVGILDTLWLFRSEYKVIWSAHFGMVKFLYLWSRYSSLVTQAANYAFVRIILSRGPVPFKYCRASFWVLSTSCLMMQCSLDAILLIRLYALYMKNRKIFFLIIPVSVPYTVFFVYMLRNTLSEDSFTSQCDLRRTPIEAAPLGATAMLSQGLLWLTMYSKRNLADGPRAALVKLVMKGGHWSLVVLCILPGFGIPYSFVSHNVNAILVLLCPMTIISMISCRMLIFMRSHKVEDPLPTDSAFQMSTYITNSERGNNIPTRRGIFE